MLQPFDTKLLAILLQAYNREVQDFYYFPEVVRIGRQYIDPVQFRCLLQQGCFTQTKADRFGRCYRLSALAEQVLRHAMTTTPRQRRKKKPAMVMNQPALML